MSVDPNAPEARSQPTTEPGPAPFPRASRAPDAAIAGVLEALLRLVPLDDLPRTGWILRGIEAPESIAGHILGVAHVALALAPREPAGLDLGRVLAMALVHDAPEALSGDLPAPAARHLPGGAKHAMEGDLARQVVAPLSPAAEAAYAEFAAQKTPEARFVKACDRLQLGVRLLAYERAGRDGLDEFWDGLLRAEAELERSGSESFAGPGALLSAVLDARKDASDRKGSVGGSQEKLA